VKLPVDVVVTVAGVVPRFVPSNLIVTPELAAKLLPVTVTDVPVGPLVGFSDIAGATMVVAETILDGEPVPIELIAETR